MDSFDIRKLAESLARTGRRLGAAWKAKRQGTLYEEMEQGAVVGFFAATLLALLLVSGQISAPALILASGLGLVVGAVIGAVLWIGSAELPEEPVASPPPGQGRSKPVRYR